MTVLLIANVHTLALFVRSDYVPAQTENGATVCVATRQSFTAKQSECDMARKSKSIARTPWSKMDDRTLKAHSKRKTPVVRISKEMKRTIGALRQRAFGLGIPLGHRR